MVAATLIAIIFVPLFFVLVMRYFTKQSSAEERAALTKETQHD